nr:FKBP12-interacting protein of 37 kDa [Tanacetum cinerariifolium]
MWRVVDGGVNNGCRCYNGHLGFGGCVDLEKGYKLVIVFLFFGGGIENFKEQQKLKPTKEGYKILRERTGVLTSTGSAIFYTFRPAQIRGTAKTLLESLKISSKETALEQRSLLEEKDKMILDLEANDQALNFTSHSKIGKMLMAKCRTLQGASLDFIYMVVMIFNNG